jgi:hypothetical protein
MPTEQVTMTAAEKADAKAKAAVERKHLEARANAVQTNREIERRMGSKIFNQGGYRFAEYKKEGRVPQNLNTFQEGRDIILDPKRPEINVFPSYPDAVEGLRFDTRTGAQANYERKHPELYEEDWFDDKDPKNIVTNHADSSWGRINFKATSSYRHNQEKREEFVQELNTDFGRAENLMRQAESVAKYGTGSFMGLQIGPDGITWPGGEQGEALMAMKEKGSGMIGLGIQAMKLLDPSGRLTDKDIEVGMAYISHILDNPGVKAFDFFSRAYRAAFGEDPAKGDLQRSIKKTLAATASLLSQAVADKHKGHLVMSYAQHTRFNERAAAVEQFLTVKGKEE